MSDTDLPADAPWWARWLVANVREAWKWASVQWPVFCAVCLEVYAQFSDQVDSFVQSLIPATWYPHFIAGAFIVGAFVRLLRKRQIQPPANAGTTEGAKP